jgi:antitoxin HigA-1
MSKSEALLPPVDPGEILREDFMNPLGLTINKLALELHVPASRIGELCTSAAGSPRRLLSPWRVTSRPMLSFS